MKITIQVYLIWNKTHPNLPYVLAQKSSLTLFKFQSSWFLSVFVCGHCSSKVHKMRNGYGECMCHVIPCKSSRPLKNCHNRELNIKSPTLRIIGPSYEGFDSPFQGSGISKPPVLRSHVSWGTKNIYFFNGQTDLCISWSTWTLRIFWCSVWTKEGADCGWEQ